MRNLLLPLFVVAILCLGAVPPADDAKPPATITKQAIEQRLDGLRRDLEQAKANLNAIGGAVQDCEYWLDLVKEKPAEAEKPAPKIGDVKPKSEQAKPTPAAEKR